MLTRYQSEFVSGYEVRRHDGSALITLTPVGRRNAGTCMLVHPAGLASPQGINVSDILKLKAAGIVTVLGIAQTPRRNLMKIKVSAMTSHVADHIRVSPRYVPQYMSLTPSRQRLRRSKYAHNVMHKISSLTPQEVAQKMLVRVTWP